MKIVQAAEWYFPDSVGGTEVYVAGLSRQLTLARHSVVVAAPDTLHAFSSAYEHEGISVFRFPIPRKATRAEVQRTTPVRGSSHFTDWLRRERPDVVHFHTFGTGLGPLEMRAAVDAGARVFATCHTSALGYLCQRGTLMMWGEKPCDGILEPSKCAACELQHRGLPKPLSLALARMPLHAAAVAARLPGKLGTALGMTRLIQRNRASQDEMLSLVDKFIVLTQWAFDTEVANGAPRAKLALNRLGVSHTNLVPKAEPDVRETQLPVRVGYLGRFDPVKGVYDLARAVQRLPAQLPLLVEFRGPVSTSLEHRVRAELKTLVGANAAVRFAPSVPPAEVPGVLASYDVLCCPSVCHEGGPTVALEAMAVGTPVVGTRIGGLAEIVDDGQNGRLVEPGDWTALADVLRDVALRPRDTIDVWRRHLRPGRTMQDVAADYLAMYSA